MTNVSENIDWVMDAIKDEQIALFNMSVTLQDHGCGTAGCIYGFAVLKEYGEDYSLSHVEVGAMQNQKWAKFFGLSSEDANELFMAKSIDEIAPFGSFMHRITKDDALIVLEDVRNGTFSTWVETLGPDRVDEISAAIDKDLS